MVKNFLFILCIFWGIFLTWFFAVFFLQQRFNFSDDTARLLINIGGVIVSVGAFIGGMLIGK